VTVIVYWVSAAYRDPSGKEIDYGSRLDPALKTLMKHVHVVDAAARGN
jgi:hypothetical protein